MQIKIHNYYFRLKTVTCQVFLHYYPSIVLIGWLLLITEQFEINAFAGFADTYTYPQLKGLGHGIFVSVLIQPHLTHNLKQVRKKFQIS